MKSRTVVTRKAALQRRGIGTLPIRQAGMMAGNALGDESCRQGSEVIAGPLGIGLGLIEKQNGPGRGVIDPDVLLLQSALEGGRVFAEIVQLRGEGCRFLKGRAAREVRGELRHKRDMIRHGFPVRLVGFAARMRVEQHHPKAPPASDTGMLNQRT